VPHDDPQFLVALAAVVYRRYRERAAGITGQMAGHGVRIGNDFVVVVKGPRGEHRHVPVTLRAEGATTVTVEGRQYAISKDWHFGGIRATGRCNGRPFTAQVERHGLWYRVAHNGLQIDAMVMTARASELLRVMPFKAPPDLSRFLLSPMPGLLVDVVVQPGQKVLAGERLAVVEAMKMENILVATQDGVVRKVVAAKGESLAVDDVILEFE
jgi:propionyl-CoA carboxylase alpha chain